MDVVHPPHDGLVVGTLESIHVSHLVGAQYVGVLVGVSGQLAIKLVDLVDLAYDSLCFDFPPLSVAAVNKDRHIFLFAVGLQCVCKSGRCVLALLDELLFFEVCFSWGELYLFELPKLFPYLVLHGCYGGRDGGG